MAGGLIFAVVMTLAVFVVGVWLLMWALARWVHVWAAVALGFGASLYMLVTVIRGWRHCRSDPVYLPPEEGEAGEGTMIAACDSAGGIVDYFFIWTAGPLTCVVLSLLTWKTWKQHRSSAA